MTVPAEAVDTTEPSSRSRRRPERWIGLALLVVLAAIYLASPRRIFLDSRFSLLTGEALLAHRSFDLSPYLPWQVEKVTAAEGRRPNLPYQLTSLDGRLVYLYPAGSALLSAPLLPVMRLIGVSTLNEEGLYSAKGERDAQALLASLLAALTGWLIYRAALRELSAPRAAVLALVVGLGTALWSSGSRTLWSHSWATFLAAAVWLEMMRWDEGRKPRPVLLGALLSAAFWVRPTAVALILPVCLYVLWRHRRQAAWLFATGLAGVLVHAGLTYSAWEGPTAPYFLAVRGFAKKRDVIANIAGMLVSPGRGMFVYSPFLLAVPWLLVRHGVDRPRRPLTWLAAAIFGCYVLLYTTWHSWWGFGQVGPRFVCDMTPPIAWLCALAWRRTREADAASGRKRSLVALRGVTIAFLVAAALAAHAPLALDTSFRLPSQRETKARRAAYGTVEFPPYWRIHTLPQGRLLDMWGIDLGWGLESAPDSGNEGDG